MTLLCLVNGGVKVDISRNLYGTYLAQQHSSVRHPSSIKELYRAIDKILYGTSHNSKQVVDQARMDLINEGLYRIARLGHRIKDKQYLAEKDRSYIEKEFQYLKSRIHRIADSVKFESPVRVETLNDRSEYGDFVRGKNNRKMTKVVDEVFNGNINIDRLAKPISVTVGPQHFLQLAFQSSPQLFKGSSPPPKTILDVADSLDHTLRIYQKKSKIGHESQWLKEAISRVHNEIIINGQDYTGSQFFSKERVGWLLFA